MNSNQKNHNSLFKYVLTDVKLTYSHKLSRKIFEDIIESRQQLTNTQKYFYNTKLQVQDTRNKVEKIWTNIFTYVSKKYWKMIKQHIIKTSIVNYIYQKTCRNHTT